MHRQTSSSSASFSDRDGSLAAPRARQGRASWVAHATAAQGSTPRVAFPESYEECIAAAQGATKAAIAAGHRLLEVEFPAATLSSRAGDGEGQTEMSQHLAHLREYVRMWQAQRQRTRVFFPDKSERAFAVKRRQGASFADSGFLLDHLTDPSGLADLGIDFNQGNIADKALDTDEAYVIAYPYFNVQEIIQVHALWAGAVQQAGKPLVIFNGDMDRLRNNYYPSFIFRKLAKASRALLPQVEAAYYIHNFQGAQPQSLFRCYPHPWQVIKRNSTDERVVVWEGAERPSLRDVAMGTLPQS